MSSVTRQATDVVVNIAERSVVFITNTMFQMLLRITSERNLGPRYITDHREDLENGLFVWLAEQSLRSAYLEIFIEGEDRALERWDFQFTYKLNADTATKHPPVGELSKLCSKLESLPAEARYLVVVITAQDASKVPGWGPTKLRVLNESSSESLEAWEYGNISVGVTYRGGT
jgi:hypothetical protein